MRIGTDVLRFNIMVKIIVNRSYQTRKENLGTLGSILIAFNELLVWIWRT